MTHLVPALPAFLARHPRLHLDLHLANRFVDLIEERYDLAIRIGTLRDSRLVARRLGPNRRRLAASGEYLQRHPAPRQPRELAQHACLVLDIGDYPERWELSRRGAVEQVAVQGPLRSNNALALLDACERDVGIALLPAFMLDMEIAAGRLQAVLPAWATQEQGIYAIYPGYRFIPAKVRALVDFYAEKLGGLGHESK